jgi:hypothetical protein
VYLAYLVLQNVLGLRSLRKNIRLVVFVVLYDYVFLCLLAYRIYTRTAAPAISNSFVSSHAAYVHLPRSLFDYCLGSIRDVHRARWQPCGLSPRSDAQLDLQLRSGMFPGTVENFAYEVLLADLRECGRRTRYFSCEFVSSTHCLVSTPASSFLP